MKKYLLLACIALLFLACEKDKSVNPDDGVTGIDLVQVDVRIPYPGGHSISIDFNEKSYFFLYYYSLLSYETVTWDNHLVTYLSRGANEINVHLFNFRDDPDRDVKYTGTFLLGDSDVYGLFINLKQGDELEVILGDQPIRH